jgi:hypothetical protein
MLGDLPDQGLPVGVRHPVPGLDLLIGFDERGEVVLRVAVDGRAVRDAGTTTVGGGPQRRLRRLDLIEQATGGSVIRAGRVMSVHGPSVTA